MMNTYMEDRPTTNMKKGWIYRNFYDEYIWEIAPFARDNDSSDDDDPALVMIHIWLWSNDEYLC